MSFAELVFLFLVFSFAAWVAENICISAVHRKIDFNSFLFGPFAPLRGLIYLLAVLALNPLFGHPVLFYFAVALFIGVAQLGLHYLINLILQTTPKRESRLMIVCYAFVSAFVCLTAFYFLLPLAAVLVGLIPPQWETALSSLLVVLFLAVGVLGLYIYTRLLFSVTALTQLVTTLHEKGGDWFDMVDLKGSLERYRQLNPDGGELDETLQKAVSYEEDIRELLRRFPRLMPFVTHPMGEVSLERMHFGDFFKDLGKFFKRLFYADTNEFNEVEGSFAQGMNFYKLLWIFFIACILGYIVETLFCLVTRGHIENRQGMLYGPFSQIYGFGAVLLGLLLYRARNMRFIWIFIISALIGGLFETACSMAQEFAFGTVSWDYSEKSFSFLGGRTHLGYMFFWGILGLVFIRVIYPALSAFVERIPNRLGIVLSYVIIVFFVFDMFISSAALIRQGNRHAGKPPATAFSEFLDGHYTDEMLYKVYPNMVRRR